MITPFKDISHQLKANILSQNLQGKVAFTATENIGEVLIVIKTSEAYLSFEDWAKDNIIYMKQGSTGTIKYGYFVTTIKLQ